jgi:hypothetical protein
MAVSPGRTVMSICSISERANSAQSGSSVHGGCANDEARNARASRTRGPVPESCKMRGLVKRCQVGSYERSCDGSGGMRWLFGGVRGVGESLGECDAGGGADDGSARSRPRDVVSELTT